MGVQVIPIPSHSHSQFCVSFPFPWDSHGIPGPIGNPTPMHISSSHLDLRFFPLVDVGLFDLEVHAFDAPGAAHDFNAAEVRLEVVENALGFVQELVQSTVKYMNWLAQKDREPPICDVVEPTNGVKVPGPVRAPGL